MMRQTGIYSECTQLRITPEQKAWLIQKAANQTDKLGKEIRPTVILRALINREMDLERDLKKIWD